MPMPLLRRNGTHTTTSITSSLMDIVFLTVSMFSFQVKVVRAAPLPIVGRDTDDSNNNNLSPQIWIPAVVVVLFLLMIFTLLWTRKSMLNRIRQLSLSQNQNSIRDTSSTSVTASQLLGNRSGAANANGNANTTGGARTRRTPSQISTISLPVYNKEPGEHELVIIRGPEDMEDAMPSSDLAVTSPTSTSRLTFSNVNVTNRQINPIRPRMPVVSNSDENDSPRSSTDSVNLVSASVVPGASVSASAATTLTLNDNANSQAGNDDDSSAMRNINMPVSPIYNPLPQTNFQMPLLGLAEQSRGESMLNIDESGEVEEEPDSSTLELMPKNLSRTDGGSAVGALPSSSSPVGGSGGAAVVDNTESELGRRSGNRNSIRNSIRNSLRGSIRDRDSRRDSRGPAPPYFEVVDVENENESVRVGEGGRSGPPGLSLSVRTNGISQSSSTTTNGSRIPTPTSANGTSLRPISPLSIASSSFHASSNGNHDHDDSQEGVLIANTNANARRRTGGGIRSFFNTLSTRPPTNLTSLAHVRHRATQSGGSGSTIASSSNQNPLSRTRSNNTLASNGSRLDISSANNSSNTRLTSASTLSVNSISAPLTHTVMRTEIRYPRGGPTPEQIRFISSKENLGGRFGLGVPYGEDAIAHQSSLNLGLSSFASLGGVAEMGSGFGDEPPPEFESSVEEGTGGNGGSVVSGLPVSLSTNANTVVNTDESSHLASTTSSGNVTPTRTQTPTGVTTSTLSPTLHIIEPSTSSSQTVTSVA